MKSPQPTKHQIEILGRMTTAGEFTAYELGATMDTMYSMVEKGLVRAVKSGVGSMFSPRTSITFKKI